jgi:hypothetical protein
MNATRRNRPLIIFLALAGLVVVLAATTVYFYRRYDRLSQGPAQEETKALVEEIGKIMVLPEGETPTIATVSDPDKLRGQVFFEGAKKGYKVLIYTNAKKAILYDPTTGKIVNVAPINIGSNTPGTTTESSINQ